MYIYTLVVVTNKPRYFSRCPFGNFFLLISSAYLGMATVRSVMAKCHQKKPLLLSNGATEPRTDSMNKFPYVCSLCKCILKYVVHSEQMLCTFESMHSYCILLTDYVSN